MRVPTEELSRLPFGNPWLCAVPDYDSIRKDTGQSALIERLFVHGRAVLLPSIEFDRDFSA